MKNYPKIQPDERVEAVVVGVEGGGERVFIATRTKHTHPLLPKDTSVTCSMQYWNCDIAPSIGQLVVLNRIMQFEKGWRAFFAEPISLDSQSGGVA